ncbi:uncharacterized protein LOC569975 [Danio rerio]|uniref:Uncharacterized protein LOC569975 n=1 Tax=Danio rerio TaxID=7955 RepID=A0A8M1N7T0_DANRE
MMSSTHTAVKTEFIKEESEEVRIPEPCGDEEEEALTLKKEEPEEHTAQIEIKLNEDLQDYEQPQYLSCSRIGTSLTQKRARRGKGFFFSCLECQMSFESKEHLMEHFRVHTGESSTQTNTLQKQPMFCHQCFREFSCREHLLEHYRIHKVEKPFPCEECGKSFYHKQSLANHANSHTDLRPYVCQHCGKGYIHEDSLIIHLRIHELDKPFKCDQCERSYTHKHSLTYHLKVHTGL